MQVMVNLYQPQTEAPFVLNVSTLHDGRGAIVFDGKKMSPRKRRFWILERAGEMSFIIILQNNDLEPDSRITISGFRATEKWSSPDHLDEVYIKLVIFSEMAKMVYSCTT